jgi:DNA polymerase (family 10)
MDNSAIADQLSMLSKLMDIHGENAFKAKSYASAAFTIEKLPQNIAGLPPAKLFAIKGIGESVGKNIIELLENKEIKMLKEYISKTPAGVLEMMNIKGLGPKKINTLWKELAIDTIVELKKACEENRVAEKKGFGEKTQEKILASINFQQQNANAFLYAQVHSFADIFTERLKEKFENDTIEITGDYKRQLELVTRLEWVVTIAVDKLKNYLLKNDFEVIFESEDQLTVNAEETIQLHFYISNQQDFYNVLLETSCSHEFHAAWQALEKKPIKVTSEQSLFDARNLAYIPAYLREFPYAIKSAGKKNPFDHLIKTNEIKGLIHSHSNWSDGANTIEQMANELISLGFEYLVISDHSKAAYYAGGLNEAKIKEQHKYVDELNKNLAPFKIFKSIECDILSDGSLDYDEKTLASFDLVITSIHSNLDMTEEKAMKRLLGAITNPYTTILGHMTGRRLLKRKGYPVNHKLIIDACRDHNVVIEINSNPQRLDMEWRWIEYALENNVLLSINPDAHSLEEFEYLKYGVLLAQKGALTKKHNLSSFSLKEFEAFLKETRLKKGLA